MPSMTPDECYEDTRCGYCGKDTGDYYNRCEDCYCGTCGQPYFDFDCECVFCIKCGCELTLDGCVCA